MAQAPDQPPSGGGGAPRQNKTVKQFSGMNTQNERSAIPEGAFHWLENIQPIGPGNLHSIPGRSGAMVEIPPFIPPPVECIPAPQALSVVYLIDTTEPQASDNIRRSWSYIAPNGSGEVVNMAVIDFTGFPFGSDSYSITTNGTAVDVPYPPTGMETPTDRYNQRVGVSDEPTTFGSKLLPSGAWHAYYRNRLSEAAFPQPPGGSNQGANQFTKQLSKMYIFPGNSFPDGKNYLLEYDAFSGIFLRKSDVIWNLTHAGFVPMHAAPNALYALVPHGSVTAIAKIEYSDLQTTTFYDLPALPIGFLTGYRALYALSADFIYVIAADSSTHLGVGYWNNGASPPEFVWIDQAVSGTIVVSAGTMFTTMGLMQDGTDTYLYYGATGSNDSTPIEKIGPIVC
jgi:hypothetical protein